MNTPVAGVVPSVQATTGVAPQTHGVACKLTAQPETNVFCSARRQTCASVGAGAPTTLPHAAGAGALNPWQRAAPCDGSRQPFVWAHGRHCGPCAERIASVVAGKLASPGAPLSAAPSPAASAIASAVASIGKAPSAGASTGAPASD